MVTKTLGQVLTEAKLENPAHGVEHIYELY